jgi:hypothetical protein
VKKAIKKSTTPKTRTSKTQTTIARLSHQAVDWMKRGEVEVRYVTRHSWVKLQLSRNWMRLESLYHQIGRAYVAETLQRRTSSDPSRLEELTKSVRYHLKERKALLHQLHHVAQLLGKSSHPMASSTESPSIPRRSMNPSRVSQSKRRSKTLRRPRRNR